MVPLELLGIDGRLRLINILLTQAFGLRCFSLVSSAWSSPSSSSPSLSPWSHLVCVSHTDSGGGFSMISSFVGLGAAELALEELVLDERLGPRRVHRFMGPVYIALTWKSKLET